MAGKLGSNTVHSATRCPDRTKSHVLVAQCTGVLGSIGMIWQVGTVMIVELRAQSPMVWCPMVRPLTGLSCRPCVSRAMTFHTGFGCPPYDCRTKVFMSVAFRTTATMTLRSTRLRRCCVCYRASHHPTCKLQRQCPTFRAAAHVATEPPVLSAPTLQVLLFAPPLKPAMTTRTHLLRALPLDQESPRPLLLPPPRPTQPPQLLQLLLLPQPRRHRDRLSFCARGTAPVRAGPWGALRAWEREQLVHQ